MKTRNDLYHLQQIDQVGTQWILRYELRANEKWVEDGEASQVGQTILDHKVIINYCPYCGEKLNQTLHTRQMGFHQQYAAEPSPPMIPPERILQCLEVEAYNTGAKERWVITQDPEGIWMLEKHIPATKELVQSEAAGYIGELHFLSGFDILFCPFCGELLDPERASQISLGE